MEDEQRRRQIEEEMARFEQEILQVQQTLPPPPPPPLAPPSASTTAAVGSSLFIPPQLQRNLTGSTGLRPPPMPPMMMPPKPPSIITAKPPLAPPLMPPDPSMLMGTTDPSLMPLPPAPDQLMMSIPPLSMPPKPPMMAMPPKEPATMLPSRIRQPQVCPPMKAPLPHNESKSSSTITGKPVTVYSAPPKKAADLEADEIMAALQKAEAELKEAKSNSSLINEKVNAVGVSNQISHHSGLKGGQAVSSSGSVTTALASSGRMGNIGSQAATNNGTEEAPKKKGKKVIRMAGQQVWEDSSLAEWDPDDFRIFCGDLGNDVTDDMLTRVFSKYPTFVRAKVIRDKRTNKSKGYGFVSFKEPQGFIKAMRELNGKYVGSRPIKLRKSTWNERNIEVVKKKLKDKQKLGLL